MQYFLAILENNILPLFILIGIGFYFEKQYKLDIKTLTRINLFIITPAMIFVKVYETNLSPALLKHIMSMCILLMIFMAALPFIISRLLKYKLSKTSAFINSSIFYNSGNYGIPLIDLVFHHNVVATSVQIIVLTFQNITSNTIGVYLASSGKSSVKESLINVAKMPSLYAIISAFILKGYNIPIAKFLWVPMNYTSDCMVAFALITLGAQLANTTMDLKIFDELLANFIRLIIGPLVAFMLTKIFHINGIIAQAFIVSSSVPSAANTALMALHFDNEPDYASKIVFLATVFSAFTVSLTIYLSLKII